MNIKKLFKASRKPDFLKFGDELKLRKHPSLRINPTQVGEDVISVENIQKVLGEKIWSLGN
jgi:hypothetical protein